MKEARFAVSHVRLLRTIERIAFDLSRLEEAADHSGVLAHVIVAVWRGDRRQGAGRYWQPGVLDHLRLPGARPLIVARRRRSALITPTASHAGTTGESGIPVMTGAWGREAGGNTDANPASMRKRCAITLSSSRLRKTDTRRDHARPRN